MTGKSNDIETLKLVVMELSNKIQILEKSKFTIDENLEFPLKKHGAHEHLSVQAWGH